MIERYYLVACVYCKRDFYQRLALWDGWCHSCGPDCQMGKR